MGSFASSSSSRRRLIFVIIIFTVISRYGFNFVLSWSEEVPRYLLIWISFLGAAVSVDLKDHIAFDYFLKRFSGWAGRLIESGINLLIFGFGWIMCFFGYRFVQDFGSDLDGIDPVHQYLVLHGPADLRRPDHAVRHPRRTQHLVRRHRSPWGQNWPDSML